MKLSLIASILFTSGLFATNMNSQTIRVTISMENVNTGKIIDEIESQTDYLFLYDSEEINLNTKASIHAKNQTVTEVLTRLFRNTNIVYAMEGTSIFLMKEKEKTFPAMAQQQRKIITGIVIDDGGEPVIGANVLEKGTTNGIITDMNGNFTLAIEDNAVLQVSYIGYVSSEVSVRGQSRISIVLSEDTRALDEVVVVGYGTTRRSDLVSSSTSVSLADVKSMPSTRIDEMLQGRSTGLVIQNTSAEPDATFSIRIRGSNSISGSNEPLVVVDGFIGGNMSNINPNDIESIEILKDASATAIYGSRGANGVIMIQTKRGKSQQPVVEINSFLSFMGVAKRMKQLNAGQYAELVNDNRDTFGQNRVFSDQEIADFYANGGTDWQDEIFRNALSQSYQVSISGGGDGKLSYYLSGNHVDNVGIVKGSSFNRQTVRSNITTQINNKLKFTLNMFYANSMNHPNNRGRDSNPVNGAEQWAPTLPVYNPDGTYTLPATEYGPKSIYNPLANAVEPIYDYKTNEFQLNTSLDYTIIKGLTAKALFGARFRQNENSRYTNNKAQGGIGDATASIANSRATVIQNTEQLNYDNTFAGIHNVNLTLVAEQQIETNNSSSVSTAQFLTDAVTYNNLALGAIPGVPTSSHSRRVIQSFVGRANYSLDNKYLFSFTGRYDGSSVFGENHKWGFFPSGAFAWRMNNEKFMHSFTNLSNLKLRISYGITGSQALQPYATLAQLSTTYRYSNEGGTDITPGVGFNTLANPDLKWEKTRQFNVGVDVGMFKQRLQFIADYYNKYTVDLLYSVPVPRASGYLSRIENVGEVKNYGFEFTLSGDPFVGKFKWNTTMSISFNRNKVMSLASGETEVGFDRNAMTDLLPGFGNTIYLIVGQPMGIVKGYIQEGIWSTDEAEQAAKYGAIPGAPKYVDQNNDGAITVEDMASMGSPLPKFSYGWNNTFSYKNFNLSVVMQGVQGNKLYNIARVRSESQINNIGQDVTDARILNRWTPENQNTNVPSIAGSMYEQIQSSRWIENASYLRVKTITLGYNLPESYLRPLRIKSARVYVSGQNLITITNYTGWDPEGRSQVGLTSDLFSAVAIATYPAQKGYTVGVNVVF